MATKKPPIRKHIIEGKAALKEIMQENLRTTASAMIAQIMARAKKATPSTLLDCIKNVDVPGSQTYKSALQSALAVISYDAIDQVRKEIPKAKHIKLSEDVPDTRFPLGVSREGVILYQLDEFSSLPPKIQKRINVESGLVVEDQMDSLEKAIYFQFTSSHDSTDSPALLEQDLTEAADDFIDGHSIDAGAGLLSAELINTSRTEFFKDEDVQEHLDALQFVNSDPVTEICQDLDWTIFAADDPNADRYQPPLHFNCKSYIVPILAGDLGTREVGELKPSNAKLEDQIQFAEARRDEVSRVCHLLTEMDHHHRPKSA
jgi:hypothetical protein